MAAIYLGCVFSCLTIDSQLLPLLVFEFNVKIRILFKLVYSLYVLLNKGNSNEYWIPNVSNAWFSPRLLFDLKFFSLLHMWRIDHA